MLGRGGPACWLALALALAPAPAPAQRKLAEGSRRWSTVPVRDVPGKLVSACERRVAEGWRLERRKE